MKPSKLGRGTSLLSCLLLPAAAAYPLAAAAQSGEPATKLDLLFVVDNSNSMTGEQNALQRQIPQLVNALTTGQRYPNDPAPFKPIADIHVGVVSTDMGIPGVELPPSCDADGGDDGRLLASITAEAGSECSFATSSQWQSYPFPFSTADELSRAVSCTTNLGTGGCGFEQPLESAFKALIPKNDTPYRFISTTEAGTWGRGDVPTAEGGNLGFLRNDPQDPSLIAIVILTDEEDCSVYQTDHLKPNNQLPEDSPYRQEDINLRCHLHREFLYDLTGRYLDGLRALRPGHEDRVLFSVIAGVPTDLVDEGVLSQTDFSNPAAREAFYANILSDARMQEEIDPLTMPGTGQGNLKPSCTRSVEGETLPSSAYPPRRLVQLAREFGEQGLVQSICQDDLQPAVAALINSLSKHF